MNGVYGYYVKITSDGYEQDNSLFLSSIKIELPSDIRIGDVTYEVDAIRTLEGNKYPTLLVKHIGRRKVTVITKIK